MPDSNYVLYLDDERNPMVGNQPVMIARTVEEAQDIINEHGLPHFMSLDHDLGLDKDGNTRTVIEFVIWLAEHFYENGPPEYVIHSANPVGAKNIESILESWKKSLYL